MRQPDLKIVNILYGLKQAPRAQNAKFSKYLPALRFKVSQCDPSLFVKIVGSDILAYYCMWTILS